MGLLSKDDLDYYLAQIGAYFAIQLRDHPSDDVYNELYSHYFAICEHIQALEDTNGWVNVKDKLPNNDWKVVAYGNPITHWFRLPDPPREETSEIQNRV